MLRESSARDPADVQLDEPGVVRRTGDGEAAPSSTGQEDVHVLAGEELERLEARQAEVQTHHIGRQQLPILDAAWQSADAHVTGHLDRPRLDHEIAFCSRLAEQDVSSGLVGLVQRRRLAARICDAPGDDPRAA